MSAPVVVLGRLLSLALALVLVAGCSRGVELDPPRASPTGDAGSATGQARPLVSALERALRERDASTLEQLATESARPLMAAVADNLVALQVTDLSARYLAQDAPLSDVEHAELGPDAFAGRMTLEYAYDGIDPRPARVESRVLLVPTGDGLRIAGFGGVSGSTPGAGQAEDGVGTRTPLWLTAPLSVVRRGETLLAVAGDLGRYPELVDSAQDQVREVLPDRRGPLVVEVPTDGDVLEAALAAPEGRYDAIAGVATSVDGSVERGGPVRVYLNPGVFGALSAHGAQVVLTHEAAHVAVEAPFADLPLWLLEGFADYVALAGDRVPVDVAARQVLQRVRDEGLPDTLPGTADLEPTAAGLGATYEEAWLACRYLAQEHGQAALVRFYESVDAGTPLAAAFGEVLGTTEDAFVQGWRQDLAGLAGMAS